MIELHLLLKNYFNEVATRFPGVYRQLSPKELRGITQNAWEMVKDEVPCPVAVTTLKPSGHSVYVGECGGVYVS